MKDKLNQTTTNAKTTIKGAVQVVRFLVELLYGTSAVAVLSMAGMFVKEHNHKQLFIVLMAFPIVLMTLVGFKVVGKYLKEKGISNDN